MTRPRRPASVLAALGLFCIFCHSATLAGGQRGDEGADRFAEWLAAIDGHDPGNPGKGAIAVSQWTGPDLESVVAEAKRHARTLARSDAEQGNRILLRGAMMHADIGRLIPEEMSRRSERQAAIFTIVDGRWQGIRYLSMHWGLARSLLDSVSPAPSQYPPVLAWYRDTSAELLRLRSHAEAGAHLSRARQIFPSDAVVLFYSGVLHERYASSMLQAGAESLADADRGSSTLGSSRAELIRAERYFRDALTQDATRIEARVRHGAVLEGLGRHDDAIAELRRAIDSGASGATLYFARLFLGHALESTRQLEAARAEFESAASLFPRSQTPRLALSYLARRRGDRDTAQRELQSIAKLPQSELGREDPWWTYFDLR